MRLWTQATLESIQIPNVLIAQLRHAEGRHLVSWASDLLPNLNESEACPRKARANVALRLLAVTGIASLLCVEDASGTVSEVMRLKEEGLTGSEPPFPS